MYFEYRSFGDLNDCIIRNLHKIPNNIDLVVGIPRSGLIPATLISLYLHKPLASLDEFINGKITQGGDRTRGFNNTFKNILVVDDSVNFGNALKRTKEILSKLSRSDDMASSGNYNFIYCAIYASDAGYNLVDIYLELVSTPRLFQWNILHHQAVSDSCFDIDGVLCPNPPIDDDGEKYISYISNAPVLYKPSFKIKKLVSCRLEKYRQITEAWLSKNGFEYDELVMLDLPDKKTRMEWNQHGIYKGKVYRESNSQLFIESSLREANDIAATSGKQVFCTETWSMVNPGISSCVSCHSLTPLKSKIKRSLLSVKRKMKIFLLNFAK